MLKPDYFDLESLLQENIKEFTEQNAGVKKTGSAGNGATETETLQQVNWQRELELFSQAAINRPSWRGAFATDTTRKPDGTTVVNYTRLPGHDSPVDFMHVHFTAANQPKTVHARISSNNMLFFTSRKLELELNTAQKLQQYSVHGIQKLLFSDTMRYELQGVVLPAAK